MVVAEHSLTDLDVLVVGSGVAGLSAAVRLTSSGKARVGVLTKGVLEQSTTRFAQGGVAAVLPGDEDSTDRHRADTLRAGAGLCDEGAVRLLVDEGPQRVTELIALGAVFDRLPTGELARALEGGHSSPRVIHSGGTATGAEVERALVAAVEESAAALLEHWFALDLLLESGRCRGVVALDPAGRLREVRAGHVLLACGGAGQLFAVTTNPDESTGDGVAMALRAGALVVDLEFVQFHPTALHHPAMPRPLLSEALRGHGALLRNRRGERFVDELQPRDVVSRAIARELSSSGEDHVWLDCTGLEEFARRFPTIERALSEVGLDPATDWLPVAPAAHYLCGGVATDLDGATTVPRLWAAGETACTGVHGANRLASNSLLEGLVFAARVVDAILAGKSDGPSSSGLLAEDGNALPIEVLPPRAIRPPARRAGGHPEMPCDALSLRQGLQQAMSKGAGIVRSAVSLGEAAAAFRRISESACAPEAEKLSGAGKAPPSRTRTVRERPELTNLLDLATAVVASAEAREESRGAHTRSDFEETRERFRLRLAQHSSSRALPEASVSGG
jgi:L-aspartate oxidase